MPPQCYVVRLRKSYDSLRQAISAWSLECSKVVAYEHPEDGNIHCHIALLGYYGSKEHLKDILRNHALKFTPAEWSFKDTFKEPGSTDRITVTEESFPKFVIYMTKGKYDPKYLKGVTEEFCAEQKAKWVDYRKKEAGIVLPSCLKHERALLDDFDRLMYACYPTGGETRRDVRVVAANYMFKICNGVVGGFYRKSTKMLIDSYSIHRKLMEAHQVVLPYEAIPT